MSATKEALNALVEAELVAQGIPVDDHAAYMETQAAIMEAANAGRALWPHGVTVIRRIHHGPYFDHANASGETLADAVELLPVTSYDTRPNADIARALHNAVTRPSSREWLAWGWVSYEVRERGCVCATYDDGSRHASLCPLHADQDPCELMSVVTGKRRKGSIVRGRCSRCGWEATR